MIDEPRGLELQHADRELDEARERVVRSVHALRDELARRADWHEWVGRRPGTFLAAAFAVGFILGDRRR